MAAVRKAKEEEAAVEALDPKKPKADKPLNMKPLYAAATYGFPGCCGINIFYQFMESAVFNPVAEWPANYKFNPVTGEPLTGKPSLEAAWKKKLLPIHAEHCAMWLAATTDQQEFMHPILEAEGFKIIMQGRNRYHQAMYAPQRNIYDPPAAARDLKQDAKVITLWGKVVNSMDIPEGEDGSKT